MLSPRWRKLRGDIEQAGGRLSVMVIAIAAGVFALTSIATAYIVLTREMAGNYLSTNPPGALIEVDHIEQSNLADVRAQPGITGAESAGKLTGRIEVRPDEWLPLLLFVVPDFRAARIGTVRLESGRWPTVPGSMVLERTAVSLANAAVDREITVQTPQGGQRSLTVTGVVHDPALAPAWQEQTVYGYVTPETLRILGVDPSLRLLKMTIRDPASDRRGLERTVIGVAEELQRSGHSVGEIRIPPYQHPHQGMMTSVVRMLLAFGVLTLLLSAVLTASLTSSLLAPQVRQIGLMKAIGARTAQIMQIYAGLITIVGLLAVSLGLPLGIAAGRALAGSTARMLNLELTRRSAPVWLYAGLMLIGVGLPLGAALLPIAAAARRTVRETLSEFGARLSVRPGLLVRWSSGSGRHPAFMLAIRNIARRKSRLAITLGLLATAGAMFMTSLNVRAAWQRTLAAASVERHFDAEIQFSQPQPEVDVLRAVSAVPDVLRAEPWSVEAASLARADGLHIVRTYPDGGHGSLRLQAVPRESAFLTPNMLLGHWLSASDEDGVVLNVQALSMFPGLRIGTPIHLVVRGRAADLRVIGVAEEHLTQATVYTSPDRFGLLMGEPGLTGGVRLALQSVDETSAAQIIARVERTLDHSGLTVAQSISQAQLGRALGGHLFILIFLLAAIAALMGLVGILGLGSAATIGVLERAREFAVMRAIGARAGVIQRMVVGEALLVAMTSVGIGLALSAPLSILVDSMIGTTSLGPDLGSAVSPEALALWLLIVLPAATVASAYPARKASQLTVRAALGT
jgi:putative ABC transport system permease protein